ncbi:MAG: hypothetical protein ACRDYZ_06055 [Acidimicrobiales bacterium]
MATPTEPPATALERSKGRLTLYASWNGATEVAAWDALGGADPTHLEPVGHAERRGFETAVPVSDAPAWVAARALDASGAVLGASTPVKVG